MKFQYVAAYLIGIITVQFLLIPQAWAGIISTKQEISIGESVARQIESYYTLADDHVLQERIAAIGRRVAAEANRPGMVYTFKVLDVDEVNAMAAPGGFIYVFKGLTDYMQTDDEIAGILAHEVGHVMKRHSMAQLEKSLGMTLLLGIAFGPESLALQSVAVEAIAAGYSRSDERQADQLGYALSVKAGYNPYGMMIGLMKLRALNPNQKSDLFSDHPETEARIRLAQGYLAADHVMITARQSPDGQSAETVDGAWSLPPFRVAAKGVDPLYRAYLAAGRLSQLKRLPDYSADKYFLDSDGENVTICYDNREVLLLTQGDALAENIDLSDLTQRYMQALRAWRPQEKAA